MGKKHKDPESRNPNPVIIAALIGLIGIIITAIASLEIPQIPIRATQTAEAAATARASLVVPTPLPTPTDVPTANRLASTDTPTATPTSPILVVLPFPTPPPVPTQTFVPTPDPSATILALIQKEASCVVDKQPDCVSAIFASDATVRDAHGASYVGIAEIRQRYSAVNRDLVFRYLRHTQVQLTVSGKRATATACTDQSWTANGAIQNPPIQRENWEFELTDDGWRVTMFTYNLAPC